MALLIKGWYDVHATWGWKFSQNELIDMLFPWKESVRGDYFAKNYTNEFLAEYNLYKKISEEDRKTVRENIKKYVIRVNRAGKLGALKSELKSLLLSDVNKHDYRKCQFMAEVLKGLEDTKLENWEQFIYDYVYFAITDDIRNGLAYSLYRNLQDDIEEYNNEILMKYGTSGTPGVMAIYAMANRQEPNIIALYEMGEMEYYGRGPSGKRNFPEAYRYYKKVLDLNSEHPLALWSISYMKFWYQQKGHELEHVEIEDFDIYRKMERDWYGSIIFDTETAYYLGCAAAANLLGKIIDAPDEQFPEKYKGKYRSEKSETFYKASADNGYVYAMNNYAVKMFTKAEESRDKVQRESCIKEALSYLEKASDMGEPWAANKLGLYYATDSYIGDTKIVKTDEEKALAYFEKAYLMSSTKDSYWSVINMIKYMYANPDSEFFHKKSVTWQVSELKKAIACLNGVHRKQLDSACKLLEELEQKNKK